MLIAEAVCVFAVPLGFERIVTGGHCLCFVLVVVARILDLYYVLVSCFVMEHYGEVSRTYVEIDVEVPRAAELSIADLKCDSHFIILMQFFVEAFSGMCL